MVDNLLVRSLTYIHTVTVSRRIRLEHGNRYFREPFAVLLLLAFFILLLLFTFIFIFIKFFGGGGGAVVNLVVCSL